METNLSFCEGKHLSPVTKKQIDEFVDLQGKSTFLQELNDGRKNVKKRIKTMALWTKKKCLEKGGLKKEKIPKRHLRGWIASPCVATLNRRRRICRRLAVGLTTRLSWQHKKSWTNSTPHGFGLLLFYCFLLWVDKSWLINEFVLLWKSCL